MPDTRTTELNVGFGTPWQEQIDFLRNKLRIPTDRWDDIQRGAHDRAFMVAGAAKVDLLEDLQSALIKGAEGGGLTGFRKDFKTIVAKHGWTGWTGEGSKVTEAWRTKVIYQTNMSTSYAAGQRNKFLEPEYRKLHPYWRYIHSESVLHPRPLHLSWHGLTLPFDHPFWKTHFAPNGWGCQCRITTVSKREGEASAKAGLGEPPAGWDLRDPKTGAQVGIDKGFDYAFGADAQTPLRQLLQDKLITSQPAIARALKLDTNRYIDATADVAGYATNALTNTQRADSLWLGFVENVEQVNLHTTHDTNGYLVLLPADAVRHVEKAHEWDGNGQRAPLPEDYTQLMSVLSEPDDIFKGSLSKDLLERIVVAKGIGAETYRAVFEVRPGQKSRALALVSLVIKTGK